MLCTPRVSNCALHTQALHSSDAPNMLLLLLNPNSLYILVVTAAMGSKFSRITAQAQAKHAQHRPTGDGWVLQGTGKDL